MKTRLHSLAILLAIVLTAITNVDAQQSEPAISQNAFDFYSAFNSYKTGNINETIASMENMGFNLERSVQTSLKPEGSIDSLIFSIDENTTAIFQTLNLDYLKNVDVTFQVKSNQGAQFINELTTLLKNDGLRVDPDMFLEGVYAVFEDQGEYSIIDSRWDQWTTTKVSSLYSHSMANYDTYYVANLKEVVPQMVALEEQLFVANELLLEDINEKVAW